MTCASLMSGSTGGRRRAVEKLNAQVRRPHLVGGSPESPSEPFNWTNSEPPVGLEPHCADLGLADVGVY